MRNKALAMLVLAISQASCVMSAMQVPTVTPTPPPTPTATASSVPSSTATEEAQDVQTVTVLPVALNVRQTADGASMDKYLYSGDPVEVVECAENWCEIMATIDGEKVSGFVYQGCLSEVAGELRCEAKP
jgi:SH3-like domain-containing protein